jgi:hypothetical protein
VNKDLYGKNYELPKDMLEHLGNHSNNETIGNLLSKGNISYSLLKKIKHRIENGEKNELGGDKFYNWINHTLTSDRNGIELSKNAKSEAGVSNAHIQPHTKDNLSNLNRPSQSHHKHNSDIKITENLKRINEIISKIL